VRAEPAPRLFAVNIDEGEPGTFKDRYFLERDPHRFLEGMLIAAWAVDIAEIYVYLRDEYAACRAILAREIAALEADPPSPLPRIHLRRGAGAYICGEESAMSVWRASAAPRLRPPTSPRWVSWPARSSTTWRHCSGLTSGKSAKLCRTTGAMAAKVTLLFRLRTW
jgi:NADH:ubiquinone oxidoreductase subunit F (NADH-binding)